MRLLSCFTICFFLFLGPVSADDRRDEADRILALRGEVHFSFLLPDTLSLIQFSRFLSVDRVKSQTVYAYANADGFSKFKALNIPFEIIALPHPTRISSKLKSSENLSYPTYNQYEAQMNAISTQNSQYCRLSEFGRTVNGRRLLAMRICAPDVDTTAVPQVLFVGAIHGDEVLGYVLMLKWIEYLLSDDNRSKVNDILSNSVVWVCPLVNPDGTYFGGNTSIEQATRYNANSVDLNRNFPSVEGELHPDNYEWQPETQVMMQFLKNRHITLSTNFHGGSEVVNYPWDEFAKLHPDNDWFKTISKAYADTVHQYSPQSYFSDENNGITNGYAWYQVIGGRQDYATYYGHSREVTIELSANKMPDENLLESFWEYQYRAILEFARQAGRGLFIRVLDSETKQPLKAHVWLQNLDTDYSAFESDSLTGNYFRLLYQGTYTAQISLSGYTTKQVELNADDFSGAKTILLSKMSQREVAPDSINFKVYLNSNLTDVLVVPDAVVSGELKLSIYDIAGRLANWSLIAESESGISIDVSQSKAGIYILRIDYKGATVVRKFIKVK